MRERIRRNKPKPKQALCPQQAILISCPVIWLKEKSFTYFYSSDFFIRHWILILCDLRMTYEWLSRWKRGIKLPWVYNFRGKIRRFMQYLRNLSELYDSYLYYIQALRCICRVSSLEVSNIKFYCWSCMGGNYMYNQMNSKHFKRWYF